MTEKLDFTDCPRVMTRAYNVENGKKLAVELDGAVWLLKFPPNASAQPNELSYSNSCFSEYLGSSVFRLLGIDALDINALVEGVPYLTDLQRRFYIAYLSARRERLFDICRKEK